MANYYNVTGWKHTGFDYRNRPYNREVLNTEYFTDSENYFQMNGVAVKRDDTSGLTYIDLQGSVKDYKGEQVNAPNAIGSQPVGGPFYSWEEVDYIRLARTGYPGDEDFIDISGNQLDPWNAPAEGKKQMRVGYYFVIGMQPLARNVTRLFLDLDDWTTMGGADELTIETGYKIRGPVTESEDASNFYTGAEAIGNIHPLECKGYQVLNPDDNQRKNFVLSAADLSAMTDEGVVKGFTVQSDDGTTYTIPKIVSSRQLTTINLKEPDDTTRTYFMNDIALFDPSDGTVKLGLEALYSAGQLELQDSYSVPGYFIDYANTESGKYSAVLNSVKSITPSVVPDISAYPRKADYAYGSMVLASVASGSQCAVSFAELSDKTIQIWANLSPSGAPYARFKGIKGHPFLYDKSVRGATWAKNAIVLAGASGSLWANISYLQNQGQRSIDALNLEFKEKQYDHNRISDSMGQQSAALGLGSAVSGTADSKNGIGIGALTSLASGATNLLTQFAEWGKLGGQTFNELSDKYSLEAARKSYALSEAADTISLYKNTTAAPLADFIPDIGQSIFSGNEFVLYSINTNADDRDRLRNYFRRYGYSGLYKPLTWQNIHVKNKVNFIQAEGVVLKHKFYPLRDTARCANLLTAGLFLWNEKPNMEAFTNQTDAS